MIFVFGSNLRGKHGAGAAKFAYQKRGAVYGQGVGRQGRSYAVPTKDRNMRSMPLEEIRKFVQGFLEYARSNPGSEFQVTRVGCGLAGHRDEEVAPLFTGAPDNCYFDSKWEPWLKGKKFWGTY